MLRAVGCTLDRMHEPALLFELDGKLARCNARARELLAQCGLQLDIEVLRREAASPSCRTRAGPDSDRARSPHGWPAAPDRCAADRCPRVGGQEQHGGVAARGRAGAGGRPDQPALDTSERASELMRSARTRLLASDPKAAQIAEFEAWLEQRAIAFQNSCVR